jgi:hypothetical protein
MDHYSAYPRNNHGKKCVLYRKVNIRLDFEGRRGGKKNIER